MTERLPNNLAILHAAFSKEAIDGILPGDTFRIGDVEFVCKYSPESTAERFFIVKSLGLVERYREMCLGPWKGGAIFELGIAEGGSTAFLALLAEPSKLIAVDLEPQGLPALSEFIDTHALSDVVRPYYGVNQADRARLGEIIDAELGGELLDVVIDDCSHQLAETRASFDALFPRLRPGGTYVIEDWNSDQVMRDALSAVLSDTSSPDHDEVMEHFRQSLAEAETDGPRREPLIRLALELVLARASLGDAIEDVTVDEFWVTIRRGRGELDPATFRLNDVYTDHFGYFANKT